MPEGDTVHKVAAVLADLLEGRELTAGELRDHPGVPLAGRRVERVEAVGKHLLVRMNERLELRSHLGMTGSWHRYAPGERWKRPARQASIVLATDDDVVVCFNAKEVECLRAGGIRAQDLRRGLGPDLAAADEPRLSEILDRARRRAGADAPLIDVLLDQRIACGIGNVYKSELLFLERLHPERTLGATDDGTLESIYGRARRLLRDNLGPGVRITRRRSDGRGGLWVYRRAGRPCLECGAPVETARLGFGRRSTYWCPACQAP